MGWRRMRNTTKVRKKKGVGRRKCCNTSPSTESLAVKLWMWGSQWKEGGRAKDSDTTAKTTKGSGRQWKKFQSKARERKRPLWEKMMADWKNVTLTLLRCPEVPRAGTEEASHQIPNRKDFHCHSRAALSWSKGAAKKPHWTQEPRESRLPAGNTLSIKSVGDNKVKGNSLRFL